MIDKIAFMETLHSVQEIARTSLAPMSKEEIGTYFKDMELTKEQEEMVYQYLLHPQEESQEEESAEEEPGEEMPGEDELGDTAKEFQEEAAAGKSEGAKTDSKEAAEEKGKIRSSAHFQMYLDEIRDIPVLSPEAQAELYQKLQAGDASVVETISNQWLEQVIEIAAEYASEKVVLDDLVQEGNIGLLMGLHQISGEKKMEREQEQIEEALCGSVRDAIERYLEEETGEDSQESTILAKVSLLHEARQELARQSGSEPSFGELSDYTKIPEEEISDILSLAREIKENV